MVETLSQKIRFQSVFFTISCWTIVGTGTVKLQTTFGITDMHRWAMSTNENNQESRKRAGSFQPDAWSSVQNRSFLRHPRCFRSIVHLRHFHYAAAMKMASRIPERFEFFFTCQPVTCYKQKWSSPCNLYLGCLDSNAVCEIGTLFWNILFSFAVKIYWFYNANKLIWNRC